MEIQEKYSLKNFNTFGVEAKARFFTEVSNFQELKKALLFRRQHELKLLFIGGGSNLLFVDDFDGIVIKLNLKGIEIIKEDDDYVWIKAMASENWHEFVLYTINHNYGGLENLSLIPGNVGTAPIQNIGAYGVEVKDTITEVETLEIGSGDEHYFTNENCHFGYRESIFKNEAKGRFALVGVTFKLTKNNHKLHTDYGAIKQELENQHIQNPTIKDISNAVIAIRQSKLPDPKEIGNSGSFFKNPLVSENQFLEIKNNYPEIIAYKNEDASYKLAAGWLIEKAGWKGKRFGDAGVHEKQALVLVNYGNATGKEIFELSNQIIDDIQTKFGVTIEREVNIIQ